jgi:hypothetical protein
MPMTGSAQGGVPIVASARTIGATREWKRSASRSGDQPFLDVDLDDVQATIYYEIVES